MSARVFISCGQREGEREVAQAISEYFTRSGYRPFVALEAQSIQDINSVVLQELKRSDYYIFIDFKRDGLTADGTRYRGSLFSHQELAIAYSMGFPHCLFFREEGVEVEGMCAYVASNATGFGRRSELPGLVAESVERRSWSPDYSRNLVVGQLHFNKEVINYRGLLGRFLHVDIENRRQELGAIGTVARLSGLTVAGCERQLSPNPSPLKVTGHHLSYSQTIWPESHGAFDLLCVDATIGSRVYLNNALDVTPLPPLLEGTGEHLLEYEVFAHGFEPLSFAVRLRTSDLVMEAHAELVRS